MASEKIYVIDTNVLIHDPQALFSFEKALIGIPIMVLEELDHFKGDNTQKGRNTREVIRQIDMLREKGSLREGVELDNGSNLRVLFADPTVPIPLKPHLLDNEILRTCMSLKLKGYDVRFVSKDINARIKADAIGIQSVDYLKNVVSEEQVYKGWTTIQVPAIQLKKDFPEELDELKKSMQLMPNEFIILESRHNPYNYNVYRFLPNGDFKKVVPPSLKWPFEPRNVQQLMTFDLLLDDNVQFVSLLGGAGTGKTFLTLVCALHKVLIEHGYEKILISRPVIPLGPDIGYLPGDVQEKLHSWMQPVYDNMDLIIHTANAQNGDQISVPHGEEKNGKKGKMKKWAKEKERELPPLYDLVKHGKISLEAITYMRGRSIPYQYIFIDEVQNLTPHEVKTIVSRVGEGSKIVLAGDPYQIDSAYLDFASNGLVVTSAKFKGQPIFGTVFLETSERSELSKLAAELL
ncbi:PhoH family protein [Candidatus Dependentiae bacterium]|nr:PhoH family protein [Candidatus Dependentiae bacterium]